MCARERARMKGACARIDTRRGCRVVKQSSFHRQRGSRGGGGGGGGVGGSSAHGGIYGRRAIDDDWPDRSIHRRRRLNNKFAQSVEYS